MPDLVSTAEFVATLSRCGLTDDRVSGELPANADAKTLARDLIRRGVITKFQAKQLLLGHADELLVGPFILLDQLGAGGMGEVFKARHRLMGRVVALKLIHPSLVRDKQAAARFEKEIQAVARLSHPNIVQAYHAEYCPRGLFLAMEFCEGRDLARIVSESGAFAIPDACDCVAQAATGLTAAHTAELVHRDIKPSNLLRTPDGTVKILDFGLARVLHSTDERLTRAGALMGTPDYIAPEQARDSATVDIRGDIYSLGCTLYYLLTGQVPFPGGTPWAKVHAHMSREPARIESLRSDVPPELAAVVRKMMARDPAVRYQTPAEVVAALVPFRNAAFHPVEPAALAPTVVAERLPAVKPPTVAAETPSEAYELPDPTAEVAGLPTERESRTNRRRSSRWPIWSAAALGVLLVIMVIVIAARPPRPHEEPTPGGNAPSRGNGSSGEPIIPQASGPFQYFAEPTGDASISHYTPGRIAFHPKDPYLFAVPRGQCWDPLSGGVELWNLRVHERRVLVGGQFRDPVHAVAFSPDGEYFAYGTGSLDAEVPRAAVEVYDTRSWTRRARFATDSVGVLSISFSRTGHAHIIIGTRLPGDKGGRSGSIEVWSGGTDWVKPTRVGTPAKLDGTVMGLAVNPRVDLGFVTAGWDRAVRLWQVDVNSPNPQIKNLTNFPVEGPMWEFIHVAWSHDGKWIAALASRQDGTGGGIERGQVLLWEIEGESAKFVQRGEAIGYKYASIAFFPDDSAIVTGDAEGRIRVWDLPSLKERPLDVKPFISYVYSLAISPDRKTLVAGGEIPGTKFAFGSIPLASLSGK